MTSGHLIESARQIAASIPALSGQMDELRKLPDPLPQQLAEVGFYRMMLAEEFGGLGCDPITATRVIEIISAANGSVGWVVFITVGTAHWVTAMIGDAAAEEMFGQEEEGVVVGTLGPLGKAVRTKGGVQVTGRWPFGSGCQVANWLASGCVLYDGDEPVMDDAGREEIRLILTPSSDCIIMDTWDTTGLRGTASNDYTIDDVFVPVHRVLDHPFKSKPRRPDPLSAYYPLSAPLMSAVFTGVARGAVEELKRSLGARMESAKEEPAAETLAGLGKAEALVGSASSYMYDALERVWATVVGGEQPSRELRGQFRGALTHAAQASVQAVDLAFRTAGSAAIYKKNPLERHFRDIHAAASHAMFRAGTMAESGRLLLGSEPQQGIY